MGRNDTQHVDLQCTYTFNSLCSSNADHNTEQESERHGSMRGRPAYLTCDSLRLAGVQNTATMVNIHKRQHKLSTRMSISVLLLGTETPTAAFAGAARCSPSREASIHASTRIGPDRRLPVHTKGRKRNYIPSDMTSALRNSKMTPKSQQYARGEHNLHTMRPRRTR
jgi:hypothetical protein